MSHVSAKYSGMPIYIGLADSRWAWLRGTGKAAPVEVNGKLLVFPESLVRCIARTRAGKRCKIIVNELASGAPDIRKYSTASGFEFEVLAASPRTGAEADTLLRQLCYLHDEKPDTVEHVGPEWYPFDPLRDIDMLIPSWSGTAWLDTVGLCTGLDASAEPWREAIESGAEDPDAIAKAVASAIERELSIWLKENSSRHAARKVNDQ